MGTTNVTGTAVGADTTTGTDNTTNAVVAVDDAATDDVVADGTSTSAAAADTTAVTMSALLYDLTTHPHVLKKLEDELIAANVSTPYPRFSETRSLSPCTEQGRF